MFIIFGVTTKKRRVRNGLVVRRNCARCNLLSDLVEHRIRKYLTLFFVPIIAVSPGETLLVCGRCDATYYPQTDDYLAAERAHSFDRDSGAANTVQEKVVITCTHCKGRLRVPLVSDKSLQITCPHCREKFDFKAGND